METPLSCMYLMPNAQRAGNNATTQTLTESWKGPWSEIRKLTDTDNATVCGVKLLPGMARPQELQGSTLWKAEYEAPPASAGGQNVVWVIQEVKASEIIAGELGQIDITYSGVRQNKSESGQFDQIQPTTWNLHWGSQQISPLMYCRDQTGERADEVAACLNQQHPTLAELKANGYPNATETDARYAWWAGTDDIYRSIGMLLEGNDIRGRRIYDYNDREIKPMMHYPIIERKQHIKEAPSVISADYRNLTPQKLSAIDKVDYITPNNGQLPDECPFTGLSAWEWLCVEDNYESYFRGTFGYTRTTVWWGAKKWDRNFYGADGTRWDIYNPPDPQNNDNNNNGNNS